MRRSVLTPTSGFMWSPDCPWNQVLGEHELAALSCGLDLPVKFMVIDHAPAVHYLGPAVVVRLGTPNGPIAFRLPSGGMHGPDHVVVDLQGRTVTSIHGFDGTDVDLIDTYGLDGDGWGSDIVGLILERELVTGQVNHAVGLIGPADLYGRRVKLAGRAMLPPRSTAEATLRKALIVHGGVFTAVNDEPFVGVRCERSTSTTLDDPVGVLYRQQGIGDDLAVCGFTSSDLAIIA